MGLGSRLGAFAGSKDDEVTETPTASHSENLTVDPSWKAAKSKDGDTAMALFDDPDELHEPVDPAEARRVLWKIDFMILPYLAVCYAFFYIDKVPCSFWSSAMGLSNCCRRR